MLRSHIASFVIGTVLLGGGAALGNVTGQAGGDFDATVEIEDDLQTAQTAFDTASELVATGEAGVAKARALFEDGAADLHDAVEGADAQVSSGSQAGLTTMGLVAKTSAELATRLATSAGAQADTLAGVKEKLLAAIDKQVAVAQGMAEEQRAQVLAQLEGARTSLAGTGGTTTVTDGSTGASTDGQVSVSVRASHETHTSGSVPAPPAPAPAPQTVGSTEAPSATAGAEAQSESSLTITGLLPRP